VTRAAIDPRPDRSAVALAGGSGGAAALALVASPGAALPAALGTVALAAGTARGSEAGATLGLLGLLLGTLLGGLAGLPAATLVVAAGASVLAWDVALQAIDLGRTLGRTADGRRPLAVHAAATATVVALAGALAYAVFRIAGGGRPVTALVLLLVGAVASTLALGRASGSDRGGGRR